MNEHAFAVTVNRDAEDIIMTMKIVGKLKHSDYELLIPTLERAIDGVEKPQIKALVDIVDFEGYEMRALWDDFRFGVKFNNEFSKIAVVGNKKWEEIGIKMANWFMHADTHYFESKEEAMIWLEK